LPAGSTVEPIFGTQATLVVPGLKVPINALSHDPNGLGAGMLGLTSGRYATGTNEADVSPDAHRVPADLTPVVAASHAIDERPPERAVVSTPVSHPRRRERSPCAPSEQSLRGVDPWVRARDGGRR
jgi:hypothetical protein